MKDLKEHIFEKLTVSTNYKPEIDFTWYAFVKSIYNHEYEVLLLDIYENNNPIFKDFYDLPEFTPNTSKPKYRYSTPGGFIIGLLVEPSDLRNSRLYIIYKLDENSEPKYCIVESLGDLQDFLDTELIIQIYNYAKQHAKF